MADREPQGCFAAILGFFGIRFGRRAAARDLPYRIRDDFLSAAELSFYRVLRLAVKDRATLTVKVNLGDIFFVVRGDEQQAFRNKIDRKHVDFLVCNSATLKPLFGVELDDKSHRRPDRVERDLFVDQVFQAAGLPLVRVPARAAYDPNQLAAQLAPYLENRAAAAVVVAATAKGQTPRCPKCGIPMVSRMAGKGQNSGKPFWGCVNFPRCRETSQIAG